MRLLGRRFATWLDDAGVVVKSLDWAPEHLERSRGHLEALGARLGGRLGLPVPATRLERHPIYGRISVQTYLADARAVTLEEWTAFTTSPTGLRIVVFDLLIDNPDRRPENLLVLLGSMIPIDFNMAFRFAAPEPATERAGRILMQWFGVGGPLALRPEHRALLVAEARRAAGLVTPGYIDCAVASIEEGFASAEERAGLVAGLAARRAALGQLIAQWWDDIIDPVHCLLHSKGHYQHEHL